MALCAREAGGGVLAPHCYEGGEDCGEQLQYYDFAQYHTFELFYFLCNIAFLSHFFRGLLHISMETRPLSKSIWTLFLLI